MTHFPASRDASDKETFLLKPMLFLCFGAALAVASGLLSVSTPRPEVAKTAALQTGGPASGAVVIRNDRRVALGPVADTETQDPVWIPDVLVGFDGTMDRGELTLGEPLSIAEGCEPAPPADGVRVAHGFAEGGQPGAGLYGLTSQERDRAAELFLLQIARHGEGSPVAPKTSAYLLNHVVVTDTSAPLHLVLSSAPERRIWQFHLAPNVQISAVTMLGGAMQATLGLPDDTLVEVMTEQAQEACGIRQIFAPMRAEGEPAPAFDRRVENYDRWFADRFGVGALEGRAGLSGGWALVIGPTNPSVTATSAHRLRSMPGEALFGRGFGSWPATFDAEIRAHATELAGGDLSDIAGTKARQSVFDSFGN